MLQRSAYRAAIAAQWSCSIGVDKNLNGGDGISKTMM
jgi:hypothetical protein